MNTPTLSWTFPLSRPHCGVPLANGLTGVLVWGSGSELRLTVARAGFWDRRGGNPFINKANFPEVRRLLEADDQDGLMELFGLEEGKKPKEFPHQLGGGRIVITLPEGWELTEGELLLREGKVMVLARKGKEEASIRVELASHAELGWLTFSKALADSEVQLRPAWDWVSDTLLAQGVPEAEREEGHVLQRLPEDDPLSIRILREDHELRFATNVGPEAAFRTSETLQLNSSELRKQSLAYWEQYWRDVPRISLPDPRLQEELEYSLYLQAISTPPQGLACTLQGALMEDHKLPPWSNDYHLNINLQMIYTPALMSNRLEHFQPLLALLRDWLPHLQASGKAFFGRDDALMLPHAIDDRCQVVGAFWSGSIDHACSAWMALLCWDYVRFSGDTESLNDLVYPLLVGAFAGFAAMAEEDENGGLRLPVSVSPEYKGAMPDAWGRNSSFQLAACHAVLRALPQAATLLGMEADPEWAELEQGLPLYCVGEGILNGEAQQSFRRRIFLWEGQDLDGSHRHHSHLAGVTPFKTLSFRNEADREILNETLHWHIYRGCGAWSGWCIPWAASLHAHAGNGAAARHWLGVYLDVFTNEGRAGLHDSAFPGVTTLDGGFAFVPGQEIDEVMQLDGRFGLISAVYDMLLQEDQGGFYLFPALPPDWKTLSLEGLRLPCGFLLSARLEQGSLSSLTLNSERGGPLKLYLPGGETLELNLAAGETWERVS